MHVLRCVRSLAAIVVAVALITAFGCPASSEKPDPQPPAAEAKQPPVDESPALMKPPIKEFQQPAALPLTEPPPMLTQEPVAELKTSKSFGHDAVPPALKEDRASQGDTPATSFVEPAKEKPAKQREKAAAPPRLMKVPRKPFDPVKDNGSIFVGWTKPKAAIVITGMEQGYIEPCGCAGLERMKGGMTRRYTFLQQLRENGWPVVAVDVGGLARGRNREAEMKFRTLAQSKEKMGYNAVAFGVDDLRLPVGELVLAAADVNGKPSAFVSANIGLIDFDSKITETSRVVTAGKMKIGVTSILGKKYQKEVNTPEPIREIKMLDPEAALQKIVPDLKRQADYLVLLAHATRDEAIELAKKFPEFNVVVCSDGHELPPNDPETIPGTKTLLITVGHKGMHAVVLGLFDDAKEPVRYQSVPLDSRFPASPEMKRLMADFQEQLKVLGLDELGIRPVPHPLAEANGRFVGSKKCESCHEESYKIWKKSGHAKAFETLATLDPPRDCDPECVSCHVVGWHPTKFFPYESGFLSFKKTPELINAGCENCHGPGEKHVLAELGNDEALQKKYRKASVITKEQSKKEQCSTCHDLDNSPDFDFDKYWPLIEHKEKVAE
jgi:hypothetical protein